MSCNCNISPYYVYAPTGDVVTGNLSIVKKTHVRKLLMKGPAYREQSRAKNEELCIGAV